MAEILAQSGSRTRRLRFEAAAAGGRVTLDEGRVVEVRAIGPDHVEVEIDGRLRRLRHAVVDGRLHLWLDGHALWVSAVDPDADEEPDATSASPVVRAPMPGRVLEVHVRAGQRVRAGEPVVRVEAMKMEVELQAEVDGIVLEVHCSPGEIADPETPLVTLDPEARDDPAPAA